MSLPHDLRLSFYISLAISCLCLFFGEWDFLPWACALFPVILGLMVLAYRQEGNWHLSVEAANRIGAVIGLGTLLWILYKVPRTQDDVNAGGVPWPAALLPLLAPLLPILLMVKLFRPKTLADFWIFQAISLVIVTLACILAGEIWFFLLLTLFLTSLFWCLALFFFHSQKIQAENTFLDPLHFPLFEENDLAETPTQAIPTTDPTTANPTIPLRYLGTRRVLRWTLSVVLLGLVLFFLTPRYSDSQWVPNKLTTAGRIILRTGIEPGIDLHREGIVELSSDPAFEVMAMDKNFRELNSSGPILPADQRWRTQVLDCYERGRWTSWHQSPHYPQELKKPTLPYEEYFDKEPQPPDQPPYPLQENQLYLHYKIRVQNAGDLVLAEPLTLPREVGFSPMASSQPSKSPIFRLIPESDSYLTKPPMRRYTVQYGQVFIPASQEREYPAQDVSPRYISYLVNQDFPAELTGWTRDLLIDLPSLADEDLPRKGNLQLPKEKHAKIAQALNDYLAGSGYYTYNLQLRRVNHHLDPTLDFLFNVKEGHCERYAGGLTLMLRSLGIPARAVKGYLGAEPQDRGLHVIRQNMAHSWVQVLVPGEEADTWKWLTLDPTPSTTATGRSLFPFLDWLWTRVQNPNFIWKSMVMDYNTEKQRETVQQVWSNATLSRRQRLFFADLWENLRDPLFIVLGGGALLGGWYYWVRQRHRGVSAPQPEPNFHSQLLQVLARYCQLQPRPGQTPLEFARLAGSRLQAQALNDPFPRLPLQAVDLLYRLRFGGQEESPGECHHLETQVADLEATLRQRPVAVLRP
jgi:transglutaminase-like putative cysteine protease